MLCDSKPSKETLRVRYLVDIHVMLSLKLNATEMPLYNTLIKCIEINHTECFTIIITI
jgi:hypothetical protein